MEGGRAAACLPHQCSYNYRLLSGAVFDRLFKRSKRQVMRDNKARGDEGERLVKSRYQITGHSVERTGRGSDFKVSRENWLTGKKDTRLVEVKTGNAKLSPLQKKRRRSWGKRYVVERVPNSPLSRPVSSASPPATRRGKGRPASPSKSFWGSGGGSRRGRKPAAPSFWDPPPSSGGGSRRGRKPAAPSFWDPPPSSGGGSRRGRKPAAPSFWDPPPSSGGGSRRGRKPAAPSFWDPPPSSGGGSRRGRRSSSTSMWGSPSGKRRKPSFW